MKRPVFFGIAIVVVAVLVLGTRAYADEKQPSQAERASAQKTSDLMLATIVAALLQEFAETTTENVEEGKKSISLIFNDKQVWDDSYRMLAWGLAN